MRCHKYDNGSTEGLIITERATDLSRPAKQILGYVREVKRVRAVLNANRLHVNQF